MDPLYDRDGDTVIPSVFTRGPWDAGLEHGGAVSALLAEVLQDAVGPEVQPARMTVDLLRPVPLHPMEVTTHPVRQGKRLSVTDAVLSWNEVPVARASLVAIRPKPLQGGLNLPEPEVGWKPESVEPVWGLSAESESFVGGAIEARFEDTGLGTGIGWLRLFRDVLPGRPPSPLARAAGAADTTGAVSRVSFGMPPVLSFVNADVSINLHRLPIGDWIRISSRSTWPEHGVGHAIGELSDASGRFGTSNLMLVLDDLSPHTDPANPR